MYLQSSTSTLHYSKLMKKLGHLAMWLALNVVDSFLTSASNRTSRCSCISYDWIELLRYCYLMPCESLAYFE